MKLSLIGAAALVAVVEAHGIFQVSIFLPRREDSLCSSETNAKSHAQKLSVNGAEQASLAGMRAPPTNNPVYDVTSSSIICGAPGTTSNTVVSANPGDKIGAWFQHVIGGPQVGQSRAEASNAAADLVPYQGANDADNPIASSHKGPVIAYLAKVENAATSAQTGLKWFKIWQDTFDASSKKWGVGASSVVLAGFASPAIKSIAVSRRI